VVSFQKPCQYQKNQNVVIKQPPKPSGNTGLLFILNHRKDTGKDISTSHKNACLLAAKHIQCCATKGQKVIFDTTAFQRMGQFLAGTKIS